MTSIMFYYPSTIKMDLLDSPIKSCWCDDAIVNQVLYTDNKSKMSIEHKYFDIFIVFL